MLAPRKISKYSSYLGNDSKKLSSVSWRGERESDVSFLFLDDSMSEVYFHHVTRVFSDRFGTPMSARWDRIAMWVGSPLPTE